MTKPAKKTIQRVSETKASLRDQVAQLKKEVERLSDPTARMVIGRCSECAFVVREDSTVGYVTPNVGRVFCGKSSESVEGQPISVIFGDWISSVLPVGSAAVEDQSAMYTRKVEGPQGEFSVNVSVESINSDIGSILIRCRRIGDIDVKEVAEYQRKRYERLVERLPGKFFFFGLDKHGTITYASPSVEEISGFTAEQVIGKNWRDFVDLGHAVNRSLEDNERRMFAGEKLPKRSAIIVDADGKDRFVEIHDYPVIDGAGNVIEVEGICYDVTESRAAEAESRRYLESSVAERTAELNHATQLYRSVVDLQTQFIVRWLPDGTCTFVNSAYCEYVCRPRGELLGQPIRRMYDEATKAAYARDLLRMTPDHPRLSREISFVDSNGREVWQHWVDHGVFDSRRNLIEIQSVGRDITAERRRAEKDKMIVVFRGRMDSLSPREHQVMKLVTAGKANKVIASTLQLSVKTVEKHRSSMMRKLQMQSVAELVRNVLHVEGDV